MVGTRLGIEDCWCPDCRMPIIRYRRWVAHGGVGPVRPSWAEATLEQVLPDWHGRD